LESTEFLGGLSGAQFRVKRLVSVLETACMIGGVTTPPLPVHLAFYRETQFAVCERGLPVLLLWLTCPDYKTLHSSLELLSVSVNGCWTTSACTTWYVNQHNTLLFDWSRPVYQPDIFITHTDQSIRSVTVDPPLISDHSLIRVTLDASSTHTSTCNLLVWRRR